MSNFYENVDESIKEGIDGLIGVVIGHKTDTTFEKMRKRADLAKAGINILKVLTKKK